MSDYRQKQRDYQDYNQHYGQEYNPEYPSDYPSDQDPYTAYSNYQEHQAYQAYRNYPNDPYQSYQGDRAYYNQPPYPANPTVLKDPPSRKFNLRDFDVVGTVRKLSFLVMGSAVIAGALVGAGILRSSTGFVGNLLTMVNKPQPDPKVDLRSAVVQQVRNVAELTTAIYEMETVVPTSRERTLAGFVMGKTTLLYVAHGEVRAGVDLNTLRAEDVQVSGNRIFLRLPPPKILDSKIDVNRSQVYNYDRGFLGLGPDVGPELQQLAEQKTLDKIVRTACAGGLLQTASDRAKVSVSQLLTTAGYENFFVDIQAPATDTCPGGSGGTAQPSTSPSTAAPSTAAPSSTFPSTTLPSTAAPSAAAPSVISPSTAAPSTTSSSTQPGAQQSSQPIAPTAQPASPSAQPQSSDGQSVQPETLSAVQDSSQ